MAMVVTIASITSSSVINASRDLEMDESVQSLQRRLGNISQAVHRAYFLQHSVAISQHQI
jgi:hypothetical protein